jgi:hypothetical protein
MRKVAVDSATDQLRYRLLDEYHKHIRTITAYVVRSGIVIENRLLRFDARGETNVLIPRVIGHRQTAMYQCLPELIRG